MPNVFDVARYILRVCGPLSAMKLQKLVYYSQAWSLVWDDDPLFPEEIQAWANGPVVPDLYDIHRGLFKVEERFIPGEIENLSENQKETIDSVCDYYCKMNAQQLSDLTHHEQPWILAREGLSNGERGNKEITISSMAEYYGSL